MSGEQQKDHMVEGLSRLSLYCTLRINYTCRPANSAAHELNCVSLLSSEGHKSESDWKIRPFFSFCNSPSKTWLTLLISSNVIRSFKTSHCLSSASVRTIRTNYTNITADHLISGSDYVLISCLCFGQVTARHVVQQRKKKTTDQPVVVTWYKLVVIISCLNTCIGKTVRFNVHDHLDLYEYVQLMVKTRSVVLFRGRFITTFWGKKRTCIFLLRSLI